MGFGKLKAPLETGGRTNQQSEEPSPDAVGKSASLRPFSPGRALQDLPLHHDTPTHKFIHIPYTSHTHSAKVVSRGEDILRGRFRDKYVKLFSESCICNNSIAVLFNKVNHLNECGRGFNDVTSGHDVITLANAYQASCRIQFSFSVGFVDKHCDHDVWRFRRKS